jgi:hypothetical protein
MAKKATSFMKAKEKGFIKVWKSRDKYSTTRQAWTDGAILVMDGHQEFNFPPGCYYYDGKTGLIEPRKKSDFPDFKEIIPKSKGYHKAEVITEYNLLKLLKKHDGRLIVILKGKGVKAFLDYEYYKYLLDDAYTEYTWKVKDGEDPILFYMGKEKAAVVMPIRVEE